VAWGRAGWTTAGSSIKERHVWKMGAAGYHAVPIHKVR
jgi:hypothetical protein